MKKFAFGLMAAGVLALGTGGTAAADPTCANGWDNHGDHVTSDYVRANGSAAGGDPSHRGSTTKPGASFCVEQSQSKPVQSP